MSLCVADVRVGENLDALYVVPRDLRYTVPIVKLLREALGDAKVRTSGLGIAIPSTIVHQLPMKLDSLELVWTSDAVIYRENRRRIQTHHARLFAELGALKKQGAKYANSATTDLLDRDVLDPHQIVNVAALTMADGVGLCVFDEQGAGKTVTAIYAFDVLMQRDEVDFALIVAPKSMVTEWKRDFERFKKDLYKVSVLTGSRRQKTSSLRDRIDVAITNFETAISLEDELAAELRRRSGRTVLIVDESFLVKSLDAQRTRALRRLRELCGRAFVLCGTPAPNSPHDLVQQFNLVDFGHAFAGVKIPEERAAAADIVKHAMEQRGLFIRHLKTEVLPDLPEKRFNRLYVPLSGEQRRLYEGALQKYVVDLESTDDAAFKRRFTSFFAQRTALLQICSCPTEVSNHYSQVPAKLQLLDSLLQELITRRGEKVVVWSFFTRSIDAIVSRFRARFPLVRYDGTVDDVNERREAVRRFQEDTETMLFVGNPAAAGAGLTLHRARVAVYESMSNQAAHYLQSLDRIHRRGQTRDVEIIVLMADGTIEVTEYQRLLAKEQSAQHLLGDPAGQPVTRDAYLAEARASLEAWVSSVGDSNREPSERSTTA
jgi:SNF2 family DNA or RNA helicase